MLETNVFYATGKRKSAIARTWLKPGSGTISVNNRPLEDYFRIGTAIAIIQQPLVLTNSKDSYDVDVKVIGGGISGQAGAIRHGISRALIQADPDSRTVLKRSGFIRRVSRVKERKKYGQKG
ncbi:MAG: 30S ribosomal protein S9 [Deltaproteobacteria bacterium]